MDAVDGFLAIDFETASRQRGSACAIGFAKFENGEMVEVGNGLINPQISPHEWEAVNISIHGITPEMVEASPPFAEVWGQVMDRYSGIPLVAHYAAFDMSVLRAEFARDGDGHGPVEPLRYACSATLARQAWPSMLSVSLDVVAAELGIDFTHHEAASDAYASGMVTLEAIRMLECGTLDDALTKCDRVWGQINQDLSWDTGLRGTHGLRAKDYAPDDDGEFDRDHLLFDQTVVFTGTLESMTRREAFQRLAAVGGIPGQSVTKKTDLLVVGDQDISRLAGGETMSSKLKKAATLRAGGQDVELIGESEFLRRL